MICKAWIPHLLCAIVGISAWIEINGIFVELGHMKNLPEGKSMASIIVITVQLGNIFPLIFSLLPTRPPLRWSMVVVLCFGLASLIFLAICWSQTYFVAGSERSVMLYIGTFIAAGADCLSNLVFWPYVGQFPKSYITAMGTGESMSSAVSAIVSSSQKAIGFSSSTFFVVLVAIVGLCSVAYAILEVRYAPALCEEAKSNCVYSGDIPAACTDNSVTAASGGEALKQTSPIWKDHWTIFAVIASIAFVQNALNPSLLPYASRGNKEAYLIAQNALFIATPLASLSASFFKPRKSIVPAICIWVATSIFIIIAASIPGPVIHSQSGHTALLVIVMVCSGASLAYSKVSAMLWLRSKQLPSEYGEFAGYNKEFTQRLMTAAGISMQIGSVTGAVSLFLLVQVAQVFPK